MNVELEGIVPIESEFHIVTVRKTVREVTSKLSFGMTDVTRIVTAASELASIGNIEIRILGCSNKNSIYIRRGILGAHAPVPIITEHDWEQGAVMVLHSDGITTHWKYEDFSELWNEPASVIARQLLRELAKDNDDATVLVVKNTI